MKKILLYCHDNIGFGHLSRMINIYRALEKSHRLLVVVGGEVPSAHFDSIAHIQLQYVHELDIRPKFRQSVQILSKRIVMIQSILENFSPDIIMIDFFPFGRFCLQREIQSFIDYGQQHTQAKVYTFMRDIFLGTQDMLEGATLIQKRKDIEKRLGMQLEELIQSYFQRLEIAYCTGDSVRNYFIQELLSYYLGNDLLDGVLVFGDKNQYRLEHEYLLDTSLQSKFHYMGYLLPHTSGEIKQAKEYESKDPYILVSLGGSVLNSKHFMQILSILSKQKNIGVKCIVPFFSSDTVSLEKLKSLFADSHIEFIPFSNNFSKLISGARSIVCGGGYGSFMDIVSSGKPALIVVNDSKIVSINTTEQPKRFEIFSKDFPVMLYNSHLSQKDILEFLLGDQKELQNTTTDINLQGEKGIIDFLNNIDNN